MCDIAAWLSQPVVNSSDLLYQHLANSVRVAHPVGHQAYIGWADTEVFSYASIEPKVQFVNSKEVLFIQFVFHFFCVGPHAPPPCGRSAKLTGIRTSVTLFDNPLL